MKALRDPDCILAEGLREIRQQYRLPESFPADAVAEAEAAAKKTPTEHRDLTALPFVTLDPNSSMDLDQAFAIERAGDDLLLRYAIADVGWFVANGGPMDREAWTRGTSQYLPDGKVSLYPPVLSEGAASLLPNVDRPAVVFSVLVAADGKVRVHSVERCVIRSRAKLAYETAQPDQLPGGFDEISRRIETAEAARGASRVDPPEQEVVRIDGHFRLEIRPQTESEQHNAALSLATNMAVADLLLAHHTGLFRTMGDPGDWAVRRLRNTAKALGIEWPKKRNLKDMQASLNHGDPKQAALMLAIRRSSPGASYEPYRPGIVPWHSAMAATYVHATAPLRRLADRYVVNAALAVANGKPVAPDDAEAFHRLPDVMAKADSTGGAIERAAIDLAETVVLQTRIGERFDAVVTDIDDRGARIQLCDDPIVVRVKQAGLLPGQRVHAQLVSADSHTRTSHFRVTDPVTSP